MAIGWWASMRSRFPCLRRREWTTPSTRWLCHSCIPAGTNVIWSAMEYRLLGGSGFKVPVLSFGTATFGGGTEFFSAWGATDVAEATRLVDLCLEAGLNMFDSADIYSNGVAEEILGQGDQGPARRGADLDQGDVSRWATGPNDVGSSRYHLIDAGRGEPAAARHRLHRPLSTARLRRADAGRGDAADARRPRASGQDPLHRLLEFLRLAPDEVAGGVGAVRAGRATSRTRRTTR